jgi:hypothetical protein
MAAEPKEEDTRRGQVKDFLGKNPTFVLTLLYLNWPPSSHARNRSGSAGSAGSPSPRQIPAGGSIRDAVIVGASAGNAREKRRNHLYNVWQQWQQCGSNRG